MTVGVDTEDKLRGLMHQTFRMVGEALHWPTRNIRGWIAIKTGHCDVVGAEATFVPHSMSDMGRAELEAFWDDAREFIRREVLPRVDAKAAEEITWRLDDLRDQS